MLTHGPEAHIAKLARVGRFEPPLLIISGGFNNQADCIHYRANHCGSSVARRRAGAAQGMREGANCSPQKGKEPKPNSAGERGEQISQPRIFAHFEDAKQQKGCKFDRPQSHRRCR
mmetsp:Transcript_28313/g.61640  ORF Transcript_28313/g.61640 Transcript_28313/m.61640 type:complete len:116 (+) Transcript_28313:488-835(+)